MNQNCNTLIRKNPMSTFRAMASSAMDVPSIKVSIENMFSPRMNSETRLTLE